MDEKEVELLNFVSEFMKVYEKEENNLPYHINVIDELHANENAHSRILAKLLQQKAQNNRFEILESFVESLIAKKKSDKFAKIKVENPQITQETERIDLWIRDKNYAIIVENKVLYAGDREQQLERYIDKTKLYGFSDEQIFVIYLSPNGEEAAEQSWGKYKKEFADRYLNLSFKEDILLWLKEKVLPNVRTKDVFLKSAVEQYIDHIEGMFSLRIINNQMNMKLQEFIKKELEINENAPIESIGKLLAKQEELRKIDEQIDLLKESIEKDIPAYFDHFLSEKYNNYTRINYKENQWGIEIAGLHIPSGNITLRAHAGLDSDTNRLYCQIDTELKAQKKEDGKYPDLPVEIFEKYRLILREKYKDDDTQIWRYFGRYDYEGVFKCFQEVLLTLTKH
jgi:hypothetical protein